MGMKGGSEGGWSTTPAYCDRWMDVRHYVVGWGEV